MVKTSGVSPLVFTQDLSLEIDPARLFEVGPFCTAREISLFPENALRSNGIGAPIRWESCPNLPGTDDRLSIQT